VEGLDAMYTRVAGKLALPDAATKAAVENALRTQFGEQAIRESIETSTAIFPRAPVGPNDTWGGKVTLSRGFPLVVDTSYTLKSRNSGIAVLDVHSTVEPNPDAGPIAIGNAKVSYELRGKQDGTIEVQESTGWIIRATFTQQVSGDVTAQGGQSNDRITWPMSVDATNTIEGYTKRP
jgi:hypothetical protein